MPQTTYERNEIHWQKQRDKRNEEPRVWDERLWDDIGKIESDREKELMAEEEAFERERREEESDPQIHLKDIQKKLRGLTGIEDQNKRLFAQIKDNQENADGRITSLQNELDNLNDAVKRLRKDIETDEDVLMPDIEKHTVGIDVISQRIYAADARLESLSEQLGKTSETLQTISSAVSALSDRMTQAEDETALLQKNLQNFEKKVNRLFETRQKAVESEIANLKTAISDAKTKAIWTASLIATALAVLTRMFG
jgi:epidermal growth factor receptor substrate 15